MISTHILDTARGRPASGVSVVLERAEPGVPAAVVGRGTTDGDGRVKELLGKGTALEAGAYRLTFHVEAYFASLGVEAFYSRVTVEFVVRDPEQHHHVPLLLSAYGYATYRGS